MKWEVESFCHWLQCNQTYFCTISVCRLQRLIYFHYRLISWLLLVVVDVYWIASFTCSQSPRWHHQMSCFIWPPTNNPKPSDINNDIKKQQILALEKLQLEHVWQLDNHNCCQLISCQSTKLNSWCRFVHISSHALAHQHSLWPFIVVWAQGCVNLQQLTHQLWAFYQPLLFKGSLFLRQVSAQRRWFDMVWYDVGSCSLIDRPALLLSINLPLGGEGGFDFCQRRADH